MPFLHKILEKYFDPFGCKCVTWRYIEVTSTLCGIYFRGLGKFVFEIIQGQLLIEDLRYLPEMHVTKMDFHWSCKVLDVEVMSLNIDQSALCTLEVRS